jgi:hypothetical protein
MQRHSSRFSAVLVSLSSGLGLHAFFRAILVDGAHMAPPQENHHAFPDH